MAEVSTTSTTARNISGIGKSRVTRKASSGSRTAFFSGGVTRVETEEGTLELEGGGAGTRVQTTGPDSLQTTIAGEPIRIEGVGEAEIQQAQATASAQAQKKAQAQAGEVEVSPALAANIAKISGREVDPGQRFFATTTPREEQVRTPPSREELETAAGQQAGSLRTSVASGIIGQGTGFEKARAGIQASPIGFALDAFRGATQRSRPDLFDIRGGRVESDEPIKQARLEREQARVEGGQEAFSQSLILGSTLITARPTLIKPKKIELREGRAFVQQRATQGKVATETKVVGKLKVTKRTGKVQTFDVAGEALEVTRPTGRVGRVSGRQIFAGEGRTRFTVSKQKKPVAIIEAESVSSQVGRVGTKRSVVGAELPKTQRGLGAETIVETLRGRTSQKGTVIEGTSVSRRGTSAFFGRQQGPTIRGFEPQEIRFTQTSTGLPSLTPTSQARIVTRGVQTRFFDVRLGASSADDLARINRRAVTSRLRREAPLPKPAELTLRPGDLGKGVVSPVAREQAGGGVTQQIKVQEIKTSLDFDTQIIAGAEKIFTTTQPSAQPGAAVGLVQRQAPAQAQAQVQQPSLVGGLSARGVRVRTIAPPVVEPRSATNVLSGQTSVLEDVVGRRAGSRGRGRSVNEVLQEVQPVQAQGLAQGQVTSQATLQQFQPVAQTAFLGGFPALSPGPIITPPPPLIPFKLPRIDAPDAFSVFVRRRGRFRQVATAPSLTEATAAGVRRVRGTPAATFRIFEEGRPVTRLRLPSQFRQTPEGLAIERRRFRIDTPGELAGITRLGIQASRFRNKRGGGLGGLF